MRPFRFGAAMIPVRSRGQWTDHARKVEALGYSTLWMGQHPAWGGIEPTVALMAAADATTRLRVATHVLTNDLHNPVLLAQTATTLDLLSEGRLEFGVGAGWLRSDYGTCGVPFDAPAFRIDRLEEAVRVMKLLWGGQPVTFRGEHYQVTGPEPPLQPTQRPHPPLFLGGGGRRMLTMAARHGDIIGLQGPIGTPVGTASAEAVDQQVQWIRAAAGPRFDELEIQANVLASKVTDDRTRGAEEIAAWMASLPPTLRTHPTANQVVASLVFLVGSTDQIVEDLQARRERYGVSYITVLGEDADAFSPIVARLAGT
jgi:probable F420-dependent oxidoreductase